MIVVFGSINIDLVFPLAALPGPGETIIGETHHQYPGGKGSNQAVAACHAGTITHMVGCLGNDQFGDFMLDSLGQANVDVNHIGRVDEPTGCAMICVDSKGQNQIAVAGGANLQAKAAQVPDSLLGEDTTLLMQMEVRPEENWKLAERAAVAGARVILNVAPAHPVPPDVLRILDTLIVNESEALSVSRSAGLSTDDPVRAAKSLADDFVANCIVTLGADGAAAFTRSGNWAAKPLAVDVVDTTAAGDAFCGAYAAGIDLGLSFGDSLRHATVAGSLACTRAGAQTSLPLAEEISSHLAKLPALKTIDN